MRSALPRSSDQTRRHDGPFQSARQACHSRDPSSALQAATDARGSSDCIQNASRLIAASVWVRASSRTSFGTPMRPPGLLDCPFLNGIIAPRCTIAVNKSVTLSDASAHATVTLQSCCWAADLVFPLDADRGQLSVPIGHLIYFYPAILLALARQFRFYGLPGVPNAGPPSYVHGGVPYARLH